jgi:hypothetical protein
MTNSKYFELGVLLKAYRDYPDAQDQTRKMAQLLHEFLKENRLYANDALAALEFVDSDYVLGPADLTPIGQKLFEGRRNAFEKWLIANDNPGKPLSTRSLYNGLKKLMQE